MSDIPRAKIRLKPATPPVEIPVPVPAPRPPRTPNPVGNLEMVCEECRGTGRIGQGNAYECRTCGSSGYVPLPEGDKLIRFMAHHLRRIEAESRA